MHHFDLLFLFGSKRAYHTIQLSACPFWSQLAIWRPTGLAMQFMCYFDFSLFALSRAYHALELSACTLQGLLTIWHPAGLTMQLMYYPLICACQGLQCNRVAHQDFDLQMGRTLQNLKFSYMVKINHRMPFLLFNSIYV